MNRETINDKAQDYVSRLYAENEYPFTVEDIETDVEEAFKDGAQWRINSVWHDAREIPDTGKHVLTNGKNRYSILWMYADPTNWREYVEDNKIECWAYLADLLPGGKEETE